MASITESDTEISVTLYESTRPRARRPVGASVPDKSSVTIRIEGQKDVFSLKPSIILSSSYLASYLPNESLLGKKTTLTLPAWVTGANFDWALDWLTTQNSSLLLSDKQMTDFRTKPANYYATAIAFAMEWWGNQIVSAFRVHNHEPIGKELLLAVEELNLAATPFGKYVFQQYAWELRKSEAQIERGLEHSSLETIIDFMARAKDEDEPKKKPECTWHVHEQTLACETLRLRAAKRKADQMLEAESVKP